MLQGRKPNLALMSAEMCFLIKGKHGSRMTLGELYHIAVVQSLVPLVDGRRSDVDRRRSDADGRRQRVDRSDQRPDVDCRRADVDLTSGRLLRIDSRRVCVN